MFLNVNREGFFWLLYSFFVSKKTVYFCCRVIQFAGLPKAFILKACWNWNKNFFTSLSELIRQMKACTPWPSSYSGKQTNPSQKHRKPNTSPLLEKFSQTGSHLWGNLGCVSPQTRGKIHRLETRFIMLGTNI